MKRFILLILLFTLFFQDIISQNNALIHNSNISLAYIENKGQWDENVTFLTRVRNINAWILNSGGLLLDFHKIISDNKTSKLDYKFNETKRTDSIKGHRVYFEWINGNKSLVFKTFSKHSEYYNYLIGKDETKYKSNVGLFDELVAENLYQGIDIRYYHSNNTLRYDLVVKPNADANQIKLQLKGVEKISKNEKGNIVIHTTIGNISMQDLFVYEKETGKKVDCKWVVNKNSQLNLSIGNYNKMNTLIIDPLIYSTFLGGLNFDGSSDIEVNNSGEAFITGVTQSVDFDFTLGAYQSSYTGMFDSYVSKLNSNGSALLFSTFIGGSSDDQSKSIKIDNSGNAYITGYTNSNDFNTTMGAFQTVLGSIANSDAFICKLNSTGTALIYSTYLGGSLEDRGFAIDVDSQNNAYVTGLTFSTADFDVTPGAFKGNFTTLSSSEVFITKLSSTGSSLIYSTLLGGSYDECGYAITIDAAKNAYVTGFTYSGDFDTTPGSVFFTPLIFTKDVFVTKINSSGTTILYSCKIGGYSHDIGYGITTDTLGNAYVTGSTLSIDYPITSGAFQTVQGDFGNYSDCFITKLNRTGDTLLFSTFIGAEWEDIAYDIILDSLGNIFTTGMSSSFQYFTSPSAIQPNLAYLSNFSTQGDIIINKLSNTGVMLYSTYLGGLGEEVAYGITIDISGKLYLTGTTTSIDYPTTTGVYQASLTSSYYDSFVTKLGICIGKNFSTISNSVSCYGRNDGNATINYTGNLTGVTFGWLPLSVNSPSISGLSAGTYTAYLTDSSGCTSKHDVIITEPPPIIAAISGTSLICTGQTSTLTATGSNNFLWNTGASSDSIIVSPSTTTNYSVIVLSGSCSDTAFITLSVLPIPVATILGNDSICTGQSTNLTVTGTGTYSWSMGSSSQSIHVSPTSNSTYTVTVNNGICSSTGEILVTVSPLINASITGIASLCSGQSTTLTANGGTTYNWNTGNSNPNLTVTPLKNTLYSVLVSNAFGCSDTAYINISVDTIPSVSITGNTVVCASQPLNLTATGIGNFLWNTGETTANIISYPTSDTTYSIKTTNACGSDSDFIFIIVHPLPTVTVSHDTTILVDNAVNLFADGGTGSTYAWSPLIGCHTCSINTVSPSNTSVYTVTITNPNGCSVVKNIIVNVENNFEIFIPDVFSPNGDGQNDILYVRGLGIKDLSFKLYDRLGEKIFETTDVTKGWDGSYKGAVLNNAVFVYELIATMINGSKISKHGDVTLIR